MQFCYQEDLVLASNAERQRPFDGLVIDWYVAHGFAIFSIITMVIFNIYAWVVINNYRQVVNKTGGKEHGVSNKSSLRK